MPRPWIILAGAPEFLLLTPKRGKMQQRDRKARITVVCLCHATGLFCFQNRHLIHELVGRFVLEQDPELDSDVVCPAFALC